MSGDLHTYAQRRLATVRVLRGVTSHDHPPGLDFDPLALEDHLAAEHSVNANTMRYLDYDPRSWSAYHRRLHREYAALMEERFGPISELEGERHG